MTLNVLNGGTGREQLLRSVVRAIQPHVAVFTEARGTASFDAIASEVGSHQARGGAPRERAYVAVASRWPILHAERLGPSWAPSKWVRATLRPFDGPPLTVVGIHLVPQLLWPFEVWRCLELGALLRRLADGASEHIIAGDFNAITVGDTHRLWRAAWWVRAQWLLQTGRVPRWALRRLTSAGYEDCYRAHHAAQGFTVPAWDPQVRIDYVFASRALAPALRSSGRQEHNDARSDARPVRRSFAALLGWATVNSLGEHPSDHLAVWADFDWPGLDATADIQMEPTRAASPSRAARLAR